MDNKKGIEFAPPTGNRFIYGNPVYEQNMMRGYQMNNPYYPNGQNFPMYQGEESTEIDGMKVFTGEGFKPLTKEERTEAARIAAESGFSFEGYQVVRREFFSHKFDPTLTVRNNAITFNNACISTMDQVVYVQVLINPDTNKLVVRPCEAGARDAIRWCIEKEDKRKSRQISCSMFTAKLYEMMGWETLYRYKMQGARINYNGEQLYVFDLASTEIFIPSTKDSDGNKTKAVTKFQEDWKESFGIPALEHSQTTNIDLSEGYDGIETARTSDHTGSDEDDIYEKTIGVEDEK